MKLIDSARNMDESNSTNFNMGRMIADFEVLIQKIASAPKKLLTADFRRVYMEEKKAQQSIPERRQPPHDP